VKHRKSGRKLKYIVGEEKGVRVNKQRPAGKTGTAKAILTEGGEKTKKRQWGSRKKEKWHSNRNRGRNDCGWNSGP